MSQNCTHHYQRSLPRNRPITLRLFRFQSWVTLWGLHIPFLFDVIRIILAIFGPSIIKDLVSFVSYSFWLKGLTIATFMIGIIVMCIWIPCDPIVSNISTRLYLFMTDIISRKHGFKCTLQIILKLQTNPFVFWQIKITPLQRHRGSEIRQDKLNLPMKLVI